MKINFLKLKIFFKSYFSTKAILTSKQVKQLRKKEFRVTTLDLKKETYIVNMINLGSSDLYIHFSLKAQIKVLLSINICKTFINKYIDFVNVFSPDLATKLPEYIKMNNYKIELIDI